jgi:hypothetical protein
MATRPTLEDPYERQTVRVGASRLGGEGLHAIRYQVFGIRYFPTLRPITRGTLVAYFSGLLVPVDSVERAWEAAAGVALGSLSQGEPQFTNPKLTGAIPKATRGWRSTYTGRATWWLWTQRLISTCHQR